MYNMGCFYERDWQDPAHEAALWADRARNLFNAKAWTDFDTMLAEARSSLRLIVPQATCPHNLKATNF